MLTNNQQKSILQRSPYLKQLRLPHKAAALLLVLSSAQSLASDKLLAMCQSCHGEDGISQFENIPNLKGQQVLYLVKQLQDFKSGFRTDASMTNVAQLLSEQDIERISQYFQEKG